MRIIAGSLKGRKIQGPADDRVRPTSDMVKEALFSMVTHHV
ncbi:MAG: 16S rRNA (guanine(966)-N(2))-methyltransferase RsmD, partial [Clostridiales bacterium]|nr:16S rRNA (guanine(966)-N(2))-methyltransferase RsmD [Clostridiales bacterium]